MFVVVVDGVVCCADVSASREEARTEARKSVVVVETVRQGRIANECEHVTNVSMLVGIDSWDRRSSYCFKWL